MRKVLGLFVVLFFLGGCSSIALHNPHSPDFATVNVALDFGHNEKPVIQIINIKTSNGTQDVSFDSTKPFIKKLYLKQGTYEIRADCQRDWPNAPQDGSTYRLPYGLSTDDNSEFFTFSVEAGVNYLLNCLPGLDKSRFQLTPMI